MVVGPALWREQEPMRQEVVIQSLGRRIRQRTNLVLVLLVGSIFCIPRLTADLPRPGLLELVLPFLLLYTNLALGPIPWQWTGDDQPRAGLARGFVQALFFNAVWVGLVLFASYLLTAPPDARPPFGHPPPMPMDGPPPPMGPRPGFHLGFGPGLGAALINLPFAIVFGWVFAEKEATEEKERRTADLLRASEARALQNQLDPHVLYNALSSLSELVYEDPLAAEEALARLADLYRMLTDQGRADRITLGQERKLVEAYLAMEQMRLGDRLDVDWRWPAECDAIVLPPLLLQPLVENAIKHGISPCEKGGTLVIACLVNGPFVSLSVENTGQALREDAPRGVGLGNLEARLALWSGAEGRFEITRAGGLTVARIQWRQGAPA